jgi:hypothetical protein
MHVCVCVYVRHACGRLKRDGSSDESDRYVCMYVCVYVRHVYGNRKECDRYVCVHACVHVCVYVCKICVWQGWNKTARKYIHTYITHVPGHFYRAVLALT